MADKRRKPIVDPRAAERRRSLWIRIGSTVAIIVIAAVVAVAILASNGKLGSKDDGAPIAGATPSVVTNNAFRLTTAPAGTTPPATVQIYEDFQCPVCKQFEQVYSDALTQARSNPKVAIDYQPVAILDKMSSTDYSTRSANASACVAEATKGADNFAVWLKFHGLLYENQPEENSAGLSDDQLASYATKAGAPGNVKQCISDAHFKAWVTDQTNKSQISGTPTVKINGQDFDIQQGPQAFLAAINQAAGAQQ
ncbi:DsbA family protein [Gordonia sp. DT30]|uniref:DsbA family protein n=1 Tax=unclassified Gordonia (in: high G+C Gram-positive bacteria) TaxID=2657482 RepID=UPI003CE82F3A